MSAFLPPPALFSPTPQAHAIGPRAQAPRRAARASAASSSPSAADAALLPAWAVQPALPPGTSAPHADAQWANFKQHLARWWGDWTYYDVATLGATGGRPSKHVHSSRYLRVDGGAGVGGAGEGGAGGAGGGVETVTHTNTLQEVHPAAAAAAHKQHIRYSDTRPRPTWIQPVRQDGTLAPPLPGVCGFQPATGGAWHDGSLAAGLFTERLVLHPHVAGARFSVGARLAHDGVRTLFLVREEEGASRADWLGSARGVFSRAMDAAPLGDAAAAPPEAPAAGFVVVHHALGRDLVLAADVFRADAPPAIPAGDGRVALRLPDGIDVSLPAATGPVALGRQNAVHIRWKMDRGSWLHARSVFDENGDFVVDTTSIYYPL